VNDEALRVRLEGALEVLESELGSLAQLRRLANPYWELRPAALLSALETARNLAAARDDAMTRAARVAEAAPMLSRVRRARRALEARLDRVLRDTAVRRVQGLDAKLAVWDELVRSVGPRRDGLPLAQGHGLMRTREWLMAFGAIIAVAGLQQPLLGFLLVGLGVVWRDFSMRQLRWVMFDDSIELLDADSNHVVRIPLSSIEAVEQLPKGIRLRALRDVELHGDESLFEFALNLQRIQAEQQMRNRFRDAPAPALWLHATLQQDDIKVDGSVVVCEEGFVFIPERLYERLWSAVVGAPRVIRSDVHEALRSLPAKALVARFQDVRELPGVVQLDGYGESAWQSLGDILHVGLEAERELFIKCSPSTQERLRLLREARR
jgi:hypothetical protein